MATRWLRILLVALLIALPALSGCGDDDAGGTTETGVTTTASAATDPDDGTTGTTEAATTTAAPATTVAATTTAAPATTATAAAFAIGSADFADGGAIPVEFTCDGANLAPEISLGGAPEGTAVLALTLLDPDAEDFVHWIAWNIPADATGFAGDVPGDAELPDGTRQAANDFAQFLEPGEAGPAGAPFRTIGYDGPCPGDVHRYVFTLYALAAPIGLAGGVTAPEALAAIAGADVIAEVTLTGTYGPDA